VFAVFTDNENKMKKMREILTTNHPKLLTYGCSSHYMNLAEKEIGTNVVVKHIVEVQKYFRNVHQARGWLEKEDLFHNYQMTHEGTRIWIQSTPSCRITLNTWKFAVKKKNSAQQQPKSSITLESCRKLITS